MAFRDRSNSEDVPIFYNINMAVGDNAPNNKEDVMLVQFLLRETYSGKLNFVPFNTPPQGNMTIDGICGAITKNWILKFQLDMRRIGGLCLADRRMDKVLGEISSISKTVYSLFFLNMMVKQARPDFENFDRAKDVPAQLRPVFTQF